MRQNSRLGLFVLIGLIALAVFIFLVGNAESRFQSNYRVRAQFQNVSGLEEGSDVRVGGLHTGTVRKIELPHEPTGKLTVVMDLTRKTKGLIRTDSVAAIKSEGMVGNKYVEISFGSSDGAAVPAGGTIGSTPPVDVSDLFDKANGILDSTKVTLNNLESATSNVSAIAGKINNGKGTVGALVNDKSVYEQASAGAAALRQDADALKHNFFLRGFFDKRGFADPDEIQKAAVAKLPAEMPQKTFTFDPKHIFDKPDSAKLKNEKSFNDAGQLLESQQPPLVVVEASAGPKGEEKADRELTQARAYAVRAYLLQQYKLDDSRIKIAGLGKTESDPSLQILVYSHSNLGHE